MLEKFSQMAEQVATSVSRRHFLGRFGRSAMALAAGIGAALVGASEAGARGGRRCASDCDCRAGQICSGGRCVSAAHICDANSTQSCLGLVVGTVCFSGGYTGACKGCPSCYCDVGVPPR